jgi:hypothetical protein
MIPVASPTARPPVWRCPGYLRRLLSLWVAEEADPECSWLDRCDGLGRVTDVSPAVTGAVRGDGVSLGT